MSVDKEEKTKQLPMLNKQICTVKQLTIGRKHQRVSKHSIAMLRTDTGVQQILCYLVESLSQRPIGNKVVFVVHRFELRCASKNVVKHSGAFGRMQRSHRDVVFLHDAQERQNFVVVALSQQFVDHCVHTPIVASFGS